MLSEVAICLRVCFFQAEDGIRVKLVTGVQTCALPISELPHPFLEPVHGGDSTIRSLARGRPTPPPVRLPARRSARITASGSAYTPRTRRASSNRSEERRVGKECSSRG